MKYSSTCIIVFVIGIILNGSTPGIADSPAVDNLHVDENLHYADSPFGPFINQSMQEDIHYINILNLGNDALLARIHLIRAAKRSINIQTFIWKTDETCRLLTYELIQAAKRGVKVKLIIDFLTLPDTPELIAFMAAAHPNFEIKFYNPVNDQLQTSKLAMLKKSFGGFHDLNQRMHNKTFIIDDRIGITGGRNYENDYFDRGKHRNFRDREVLVIGNVVKSMTDSFSEYWSSPISVSSMDLKDLKEMIETNKHKKYASKASFDYGNMFDNELACAKKRNCLIDKFIVHHYMVKDVEFIADKPGKKEKLGKYKTTMSTYRLGQFMAEAKKSVVMQTPYLVIDRKFTYFFLFL